MKTRKKIPAHIAERWQEDDPICDICKNTITKENYYDQSEINIDAKLGDFYPDGGDCRTGYRLDVCRECFEDKLMPLIEEAFGVKFAEYDVETYDGYYANNDDELL